ncbi:MAG: hypothetical protein IJJ33_14895 [Victivallales bacterium]|nr:hypothetical protein [Victivallales bacterium]
MAEDNSNKAYSRRHLWAGLNEKDQTACIGITEFLAEQFHEIISIDLPEVDDEIDVDMMFIHFHLGSRIYHLRSPLSGRILEINKEVLDNPSLLHLNPNIYWMVKMEYDNAEEIDLLMDERQYTDYIDKL